MSELLDRYSFLENKLAGVEINPAALNETKSSIEICKAKGSSIILFFGTLNKIENWR